MSELTAKEKKWLKKVQKALNECPSDRIGFYTIGDNNINAYDCSRASEVFAALDSGCTDFGPAVDEVGAGFGESLDFPNPVESTAG